MNVRLPRWLRRKPVLLRDDPRYVATFAAEKAARGQHSHGAREARQERSRRLHELLRAEVRR